jgi:hypothetical protein
MNTKKLFSQKFNMGIKYAVFNADFENLWKTLLEKIRGPGDFAHSTER